MLIPNQYLSILLSHNYKCKNSNRCSELHFATGLAALNSWNTSQSVHTPEIGVYMRSEDFHNDSTAFTCCKLKGRMGYIGECSVPRHSNYNSFSATTFACLLYAVIGEIPNISWITQRWFLHQDLHRLLHLLDTSYLFGSFHRWIDSWKDRATLSSPWLNLCM